MNTPSLLKSSGRRLIPAMATCIGLLVVPWVGRAGEESPDPLEQPNNWVNLALGGLILHGDHGQASHQLRLSDNLFGGIEDLHLEQALGHDFMLKLDGHFIPGNEDYLAKIEISKEDLGYVRAGYSQFRTWYDGNGGFFPFPMASGGLSFDPEKNVMGIDRGQVFAEFGLRDPELPEITLRYEHDTRHGQKDSTIWGDTSLTGIGTRKIAPAFRNINEVRDLFTLDLAQPLGKTDLQLGVRFEHESLDNSLNLLFNPTQPSERRVTQHDGLKEDLFSTHGSSVTRFGDKVWFSLGYAFTTFDTDLSGSRVYGNTYDADFDPSKVPLFSVGQGFYQLTGGSEWGQHVANMNLMWRPIAHLSVIAATRFESQRTDSSARFVDTEFLGDAYGLTPFNEHSSDDTTRVAESFELRYTGLPGLVLYGRGEWIEETGAVIDEVSKAEDNTTVVAADIDRNRMAQKYEMGGTWYMCQRANLSAQYYRKIDDNRYSNSSIPQGPPPVVASSVGFPGRLSAQNFDVNDVNVRFTLHPLSNVSLVSQYDFQRAEFDTDTFGLGMTDSGKATTHIFSEAITWAPIQRLFLQAGFSYFLSRTESPATVTVSNLVPENHARVIGPENFNFKNNYWTANLTAGCALDDKTNLQAVYTFFRADNYVNNANITQPYGAGGEQHTVTVSLTRQLLTNITALIKCGYYQYTDQTSGGLNNYSGVLLYSGLQVRF